MGCAWSVQPFKVYPKSCLLIQTGGPSLLFAADTPPSPPQASKPFVVPKLPPNYFSFTCDILPGAGAASNGDEALEGGGVQCDQRGWPHASVRLAGLRCPQPDLPPQVNVSSGGRGGGGKTPVGLAWE